MIAVDTNIVIRFLTHDDAEQYKKAFSVFNTQDVFITDTVILETEWVLRYAYEFSPEDVCCALRKLFGLKSVHLSNPTRISQAIDWHQHGMDFSDALHLTNCQQHKRFYTFDKKCIAKANSLTKLSVELL